MSTQSNTNTHAGARNKWLWLGGLVALLVVLGVALALNRSGQNGPESAANSAPVVTPGANPPGANAPADPHALAAGSFAEAGKTWGEIEQARAGLDQAIQTEKLEQVHQAAFAVRDQVRRLPEHSAALPAPQRQELQAHVQHVDQLAQMLDEAGDAKNVRSTHQHHVALNDTLAKIRALYPEGALPAGSAANGTGGMTGGMHGGGMMDDDKMGGMSNLPGGGMGSGMMDDKMGGMGGGMMDDDKMGGMGGGMPGDKKTPAKKAPAKKDPAHPAPAPQGGGGMGGHM